MMERKTLKTSGPLLALEPDLVISLYMCNISITMSNYQIAKGPIPYVGLYLDYYVIIGFFWYGNGISAYFISAITSLFIRDRNAILVAKDLSTKELCDVIYSVDRPYLGVFDNTGMGLMRNVMIKYIPYRFHVDHYYIYILFKYTLIIWT